VCDVTIGVGRHAPTPWPIEDSPSPSPSPTGDDGSNDTAPPDRTTIAEAIETIARADLTEVLEVVESASPPDKARLADRLSEVQSHLRLTEGHN
jgi:hypothetical protein